MKLKRLKKISILVFPLFALVCVLMLTPTNSAAKEVELSFVIENLQNKYDNIETLSADFLQEAYSSSLKSSQRAKGTVAFKKPGMMRWDYYGGGQIISNGKFIWVYD
ncbi:MAG: outer membrane lipoprotein carrier protein LolA, partial [Proteobacteria bacterium]|nr:outer membrane lipoprotein carrier protein LolA [Pseudomonadota bacterium]